MVAAAIGVLATSDTRLAWFVSIGVLALSFFLSTPMLIVAMAVPATLVLTRVGGFVSVSDVILAVATIAAVVLVRPKGMSAMRPFCWAGIAYLVAALPTLILNPYQENTVEWVHEFVLVIGSLLVGFTIARTGKSSYAIGAYVLGCLGIAVAAIATAAVAFAIHHELEPVYLPELHKNLIGGMLATAFVIVHGRPAWFAIPRNLSYFTLVVLAGGIFASQSRQSMLGLLAGLLIVGLRRRAASRRRPLLGILLTIPVLGYSISMLSSQLASDNQFNSAYQRLDWFEESLNIWHESPAFGVGLRWWYTDRFAARFQPPNAELEVLSSVGIVGLIGFLLMFALVIWYLWRLDPTYGTVGAAVVVARFVQAQFDLYWVAGQASLLWIVAGVCVGAFVHDRSGLEQPDSSRQLSVNYVRTVT
ncbi:O-antigen ligase like membrane protein [Paramicrobacterium humi]|uniref:O-antigen ligase like membrane protein n=1 Tax=Paramicrobacterium humi TaxID=640635 RepID=A0A1H4MKF5_9MICO|nr:O-antigen ligase family protein [Microbacterium humi]SEB83489.1 O-antigen ligase like membrane protein [Microbacterium humi]